MCAPFRLVTPLSSEIRSNEEEYRGQIAIAAFNRLPDSEKVLLQLLENLIFRQHTSMIILINMQFFPFSVEGLIAVVEFRVPI